MLASRTVTATGHGAVTVPRDSAVLDVAAVHRGSTLSEALAGAESARAAVVEVARAHVDPTAISTQALHTYPHHGPDGAPAGHEARHALRVRCPDLGGAATLVQALADAVGDRLAVDGVQLATTPTADHLAAAREAAYADARSRAEHLARLAGSTIGAVVHVTDGAPVSAGGPPTAVFASVRTDVDLEGGTAEVSATVTVTWELG